MNIPFRKIDIDKYDEDVLNDEDLYDADPRDPSQVLDEARQRQAAVRGSLAKYGLFVPPFGASSISLVPTRLFYLRNNIAEALEIILENAPYGPNVDEAKVSLQFLL
jgi:actin related protein 2/3 complex subunit 5